MTLCTNFFFSAPPLQPVISSYGAVCMMLLSLSYPLGNTIKKHCFITPRVRNASLLIFGLFCISGIKKENLLKVCPFRSVFAEKTMINLNFSSMPEIGIVVEGFK